MTGSDGFDLTPREGPSYAGVGATFCGRPLVHDPGGLEGVDVAVLGAPFDDGTSNRPGARYGPRAIRAADDGGRYGRPNMTLGLDPLEVLRVVDYGDAEVAPADLQRSHDGLEERLREILAAGALPLVLGGDHSLSLPTMRVLAERHGAGGYAVLHLDTHADTAASLYGVRLSHGTPFRVAVEEGVVRASQIVQVGLRGTWPEPEDFEWMRGEGFRWHTMDEILQRGLTAVIDQALEAVAEAAPRVYMTVDIDVLDPPSRPEPAPRSPEASPPASSCGPHATPLGRSTSAPPTSSRYARPSTMPASRRWRQSGWHSRSWPGGRRGVVSPGLRKRSARTCRAARSRRHREHVPRRSRCKGRDVNPRRRPPC